MKKKLTNIKIKYWYRVYLLKKSYILSLIKQQKFKILQNHWIESLEIKITLQRNKKERKAIT